MITFVTRHDNESVCIRTIVNQLIEQGIRFRGWEEQELPREIPPDFESYPALIADEEILRDADEGMRRRLNAYASRSYVYIIGRDAADPALPLRAAEDFFAVELNVFQAASGLKREEFPALPDKVIIDGFFRRAEEYFATVPGRKFFNEYHLHFLIGCMALEGTPFAPQGWTERIDAAMESMFRHEDIQGDHDQVAAWMLARACFQRTGNKRPVEFLVRLCDELIRRRPRTAEGLPGPGGFADDPLLFSLADTDLFGRNAFTTARRDLVLNEQLHYLGGTFAAAAAVTSDMKYLKEACALLDHIEQVHRDPADGLLFHASRRGEIIGVKWGRGNTHALLGAFYMLRTFPEMPAGEKEKVVAFLDRSGRALRNVQSESGFWRNILNAPDAPDETSCTVIITAIYAWGVNNGLFDRDFYLPMIRRARNAVKRKFWRGYGSGNCRGTLPAYKNPDYYVTRGQHIQVMPLITLALVESAKTLEIFDNDPAPQGDASL